MSCNGAMRAREGVIVMLLAPAPNWAEQVVAWTSIVGSAFAFVAVVVAAVAARAAFGTNAQQAQQLKLLEEDAVRDQASKVAAWVRPGESDDDSPGQARVHVHEYLMINASSLPIFEVEILDERESGKPFYWEVGMLEPRDEPQRVGVLRMNEAEPRRHGPVSVIFLDSNGRRWTRDRSGLLTVTSERALETLVKSERPPADDSG